MIELSAPVLGEEEKQTLCSVVDSGWLSMGDRVAAFEQAFAHVHGMTEAVAVSSCTAGLHLCLEALGVGPGDEVLVPSLTFVATVNAVMYLGAEPVFVDIEKTDVPHIALKDAKAKRSSRTKAVILMHYGGYLVDLPAWRSFAESHGLKLIEDAAHAPGVEQVGLWSDASVFSFFPNKNLTTGEGGMILARENSLLEKMRRMRAHGMTTNTLERDRGHASSYDVTIIGYNYRMDELRAALGLVQLRRLPEWNERRRELTAHYRDQLGRHLPEIVIPFEEGHSTAAHLMPILLPEGFDREKIMKELRQNSIQTSIHYPPVHQFSFYRERFPDVVLPKTEKFSARELSLPLHPALTKKDVEKVVHSLQDAIANS
jgi:dTDP-4-amino-4,6-dideoxygalactose transaminase